MSEALQEFAINLPMIAATSLGGVSSTAPVPAPAPAVDVTAAYALPPEIAPVCNHIYVNVDSASVANYDQSLPMVCVDLVLSVNVTNPDTGASSNYKLVKRISMDKIKLAHQAELETPYQVVEAEEPEDDALLVEQQMAQFHACRRAQEMAGIFESRGDKIFKVSVKHDDPSGSGIATTHITVDAVKDAAHARHVVTSKHMGKLKNAKIVRAVEVKKEA